MDQRPTSDNEPEIKEETENGTKTENDIAEPPLLESFEWLEKFQKILVAFSKKRPISQMLEKIRQDMSYFKPALHDIAFTRFTSKACMDLARVIIDHGNINNYMFWIEVFEPYVVYDSRYEVARVFLYLYISKAIELKNVFFNSIFLQYALCLLDEDTYPKFLEDLSGVASNQDADSLKIFDQFAQTTQNFMKFKVIFCTDILVRWANNFCYFENIASSMNSTFDLRLKRFLDFEGFQITFRQGVSFEVPKVSGTEELLKFKKQFKNFRRYCHRNSLIQ